MTAPIPAQKAPYGFTVENGKQYWWCACGRSRNQPFCDGSHKGTGLTPLAYTATADEQRWFCGCKHSLSKPFCDGTHKTL